MIIVDTNVASELMQPTPESAVVSWTRSQSASELAMTSLTVAEILYGIEGLPDGWRKEKLKEAVDDELSAFAGDVLAFDARVATEYAGIASSRERSGTPIDGFDAQIASICRVHHARLSSTGPPTPAKLPSES